jgi:hypothetical protein
MEALTRLVSQSMARHGLDTPVDHRRLNWSPWFACRLADDVRTVPARPGLFSLGEELVRPGELATAGGKRLLAVSQISEAHDLGVAMGQLFAPCGPLRQRLAEGGVFARYTVIEDEAERATAYNALQRWLTVSAESASGVTSDFAVISQPQPVAEGEGSKPEESQVSLSLPAGF